MQIHWLSFTVHAPIEQAEAFYSLWLRDAFGPAHPGPGGMFYSGSLCGLLGARVYTAPVEGGDYWTVSLPGQACEAVSLEWFRSLSLFLEGYYQTEYTRLDLAFDDWPFSPAEMKSFEASGEIASPARPRGQRLRRDQYHEGVDGDTWEIGSRTGGRFLRVYDRRGVNRLEIELHHEHAKCAMSTLFIDDSRVDYSGMARGIVEMFLRVRSGRGYHEQYKLWLEARVILDLRSYSPARDTTLERSDKWLVSQVATALSVMQDVCGRQYIDNLLQEAYLQRYLHPAKEKRYRGLLDFADWFPSSQRPQLLSNRAKAKMVTKGALLIGPFQD